MATTEKQKRAIGFCETFLDVKFTGDKEDFQRVSNFLSKYLDKAKAIAEEVSSCGFDPMDVYD